MSDTEIIALLTRIVQKLMKENGLGSYPGIQTDLFKDLGFNSMMMIELIANVEDGLELEVPDPYLDIAHFVSLEKCVETVRLLA